MMLPSRSRMLTLTMTSLLLAAMSGCGTNEAGASGNTPAGSTGDGFGEAGGFNPAVGAGAGPDVGSGGVDSCNPQLVGIVRDFQLYTTGGHPDFEHFMGGGLKGIVTKELGADKKPVYASAGPTEHTTGPKEFNQWYRDDSSVNKSFEFTIPLKVDDKGIGTYDNSNFFPIDDKGFGKEGQEHNFGFTFELHMTFVYKGGEKFSFTGDDDLWVFVNNRLAIDLGGLHGAQSATLDLDARASELGIEAGKEYPLDFFQAERHSTQSNFKIQSSLNFTNCDPIVIPK